MASQLTIPIVLGWDISDLRRCGSAMLEAARTLDFESVAAGKRHEQSASYFVGKAGNASRGRGHTDRNDAVITSDVIEAMAKDLNSFADQLHSKLGIIRETKKEVDGSMWDLYVTDEGTVKSRKSDWETFRQYMWYGGGTMVALKNLMITAYSNRISAALTWVQRIDAEGSELYIRNIEQLPRRVKEASVAVPLDPHLARILREYQTPASTKPPRLFPVGVIADLLSAAGHKMTPSFYTEEEISAMETLLRTQGIDAVAQAEELPKLARSAAEAYVEEAKYAKGSVNDGHGDAFRHIYWNALMTQKFGPEWAEQYATAHEKTGGNMPQREAMDLYNNELGRKIGELHPNADPNELKNKVIEAINRGDAVVIRTKDDNGVPVPTEQIQIARSNTPHIATGSPRAHGVPLPGVR